VAPEPTAAQSLETSAIHRRGRNGRHFPLPKGFSCDGALKCVTGDRHGRRHGENGLDKRFFQRHDAHDDESRRFSWQRRLACLKGEETEGDLAIIATRHRRVPTASPAPKAMRLSDCQTRARYRTSCLLADAPSSTAVPSTDRGSTNGNPPCYGQFSTVVVVAVGAGEVSESSRGGSKRRGLWGGRPPDEIGARRTTENPFLDYSIV
jgi:hypothetical protein